MYLEMVKKAYHAQSTETVEGCSSEEIHHLEQLLRISLPAAYREFLLWAGHGAGDLFDDIAQYTYAELLHIQESARAIAEIRQFDPPLPHDAMVIVSYDDMQFHFICASEGDDPPVYFFFDTACFPDTKLEKRYYRDENFSQWMLGFISE